MAEQYEGGGGFGGEVRINPERVRDAGTKFGDVAQKTEQDMAMLTNLMNGMRDEWKGMASAEFYKEFEQWQTTVKNYVAALRDISQDLVETARDFEELEARLKARISGIRS